MYYMESKFIHRVSKGSRFNQIYIPKEMEKTFEIGDIVSVELIRKNQQIYLKNAKLSEFKEKLIREISSFLSDFKEIKQVFLVGSFITQKIDYRDIDLLIITKENKTNETEIYSKLIDKFNLKFHVIAISEEKFTRLSEICPLTRNMLSSYVSNKEFTLPKSKLDKNHIRFLMMMPEDLLKIKANSRTFYDSIRRLVAIEKFLDNNESSEEVSKELKQILGNSFEYLKNNEEISKETINRLRKIIKEKLNNITALLKK